MKIAGFIKNSFVDYPGYIAAVVFVPGCNMDCWYCHNKQLWESKNLIDEGEIDAFLEKRSGFIDGVVISGGEPTLQKDLAAFIAKVKDKGYLVKLDTNGLRPDVVKDLLPHIDYIAMDLKAPPGEIYSVVSFDIDESLIWESVDIIMDSDVDYEFRTTFMPIMDVDGIQRIAKRIKGAKKYALQQYRKTESIGISPAPHKPDVIRQAEAAAKGYVKNIVVRGL